jgi:predicted enzyme related to lactoylglutathione lyase
VGYTRAGLILGGRGLASDYRQETDGKTTLEAHTVIRWDGESSHFVMYFHSEPGGDPMVLRGSADGESLVFQGAAFGGIMRQTLTYGPERMQVRTEFRAADGDPWDTLFEAEYGLEPGPDAGSEPESPAVPGRIGWADLTVQDAPAIRDFWAAVTGWEPDPVSMGDYSDFNMLDGERRPAAGICHARGSNADMPTAWLPYVVVDDLDASLEAAVRMGGEVVVPLRGPEGGRFAVVRDPAGAVLALWENRTGDES